MTTDNKALAELIARWRGAAEVDRDYYSDALTDCANELERILTASPQVDEGREPTDNELLGFAIAEQFLLFCDGDEFVQIARAVLARFTTPQPQGDASGQVSGGGEITDDEIDAKLDALHKRMRESGQHNGGMVGVAWNRAIYRAALSPTQARPNIDHLRGYYLNPADTESFQSDRPAPTADGGAVPGAVWLNDGVSLVRRGSEDSWCTERNARRMYLHPAPKAEVARLVEAGQQAVTSMQDSGYTNSHLAVRAMREALRPFTTTGETP